MLARILRCWLLSVLGVLVTSATEGSRATVSDPAGADASPVAEAPATGKLPLKHKITVYVVPVRDEIATPVLYILRRGLKEAIERKAGVVVFDLETPGGALDVTFEMMKAIEKFPGQTIAYVDKEAMSAGAFISATTQEIWFAPGSVIGAAAPVTSAGKDIDETMKLKVVSYLKARLRAISEGKGYRGQVIEAMIDKDYELKIGDAVIKPKGELLSLTATEASKTYGNPPQSLLAAGIATDLDDLLNQKFGANGYEIVQLNVTWSEELAVWLNAIAPILMGLGVICLIIEFKTPGFGVFGLAGIVLFALVFLGHFVAGFSGHEPMILFAVGMLLLAVELFFFPGVAVLALSGVTLMFGSLVWAMADIWPNEPVTIAVSGDLFVGPLINLGIGVALALIMGALLMRFLPKGWMWDRMVLQAAATTSAQVAGSAPEAGVVTSSLVGARGVVVTGLFPGGQIEIDGRRYEAKLVVGSAPVGAVVVVKRASDFNLVVEIVGT
jgi:membrane-bound serine protease (ClpP class)